MSSSYVYNAHTAEFIFNQKGVYAYEMLDDGTKTFKEKIPFYNLTKKIEIKRKIFANT